MDPSDHKSPKSREFSPAGWREDAAECERAGATGGTQHASTGSEMQGPRASTRERPPEAPRGQQEEGLGQLPGLKTGQLTGPQGYHLRELTSASARVSLQDSSLEAPLENAAC